MSDDERERIRAELRERANVEPALFDHPPFIVVSEQEFDALLRVAACNAARTRPPHRGDRAGRRK